MNIGGDQVTSSLRLPRTEVPLEIRKNFAALKHVPLFYSSYVTKLSHRKKPQERLLLCTIDHCYVCHPNGDVMRCFPYSFISHIFHDPMRKEMALVVPREYDVLFQCTDTLNLLHVLETLRGLHLNSVAMEIRTLTRDRNDRGMSMLQDYYHDNHEHGDIDSYGFDRGNKSGADVELDTIMGDTPTRLEDPPSGLHPPTSSLGPLSSGGQTSGAAAEEKEIVNVAKRRRAGDNGLSIWGKIKEKLRPTAEEQAKKRAGVIIGWNDQWVLHNHPQMRAGTAEEVALGKGQWAVRLNKPEGWKLEMFYRADGSIVEEDLDTEEDDDSDDSDDEEEEEEEDSGGPGAASPSARQDGLGDSF